MWGILLKTKKNKAEKSFSPIVAQIELQNGNYLCPLWSLWPLWPLRPLWPLWPLFALNLRQDKTTRQQRQGKNMGP